MMEDLHPARKWTVWAFAAGALLTASLLVWQLYGLTPAVWCGIAKAGTENERLSACLNVLVRLLDLKDHVLIGLLALLGVIVIALVAVVLGVTVRGSGPGGVSVDIGAEKTHIDTSHGSVTIPTPPAGEQ